MKALTLASADDLPPLGELVADDPEPGQEMAGLRTFRSPRNREGKARGEGLSGGNPMPASAADLLRPPGWQRS